jgi:hypothetical protein
LVQPLNLLQIRYLVRDIRGMLAVFGGQINRSELNDWILHRQLEAEWQKALD